MLYWIGINLDIEQRKQAEFYLAEGQRLAHAGSWAFDATGFGYWSSELFKIYGLEPGGRAPSIPEYIALVHPEDRGFVAREIQKMLAERSRFDFTKRIVRPDGAVRYVHVDTLTSIKVFRNVIEAGSFVGAAERLDISAAMVSRHVMHVERRLGVRLLHRNSRTLSLTEPGRVYFERCKTILDDLEATELQLGIMSSMARGTLRISCPSWFTGCWPADLLARFHRRYPEILIDLSFDDGIIDLVQEGYDLALRATASSNTLPPGMVAAACGRCSTTSRLPGNTWSAAVPRSASMTWRSTTA